MSEGIVMYVFVTHGTIQGMFFQVVILVVPQPKKGGQDFFFLCPLLQDGLVFFVLDSQ